MAEVLKKFGKYFLLDQIAQGGMAEIFRARMATADGGGRLICIKRIIPSYSQNSEFVTMFKAEIKTTSGFAHPNIVQLYDFGEEEKMLYIAMEYVDGKNLRQLISRFSEMKSTFPVEICAYVMEQAAMGMGYAHAYKDKFSGKPLNIVHRDISPQNIVVSFDGAVKVIDFGIAKAVTNLESTRAGVIKGKPSYLSPEQIAGEPLDGRSDIFAMGIVLWELLTGRKLFAGDNDFAVLKLIENCSVHVKPPSLFNSKVPKEFDAIVLKCLQKDPAQRYQTAEEMQRAIHKFLYQFYPDFNPTDLAYYARDLFKNEIVEDRKKLLRLNDRAEQLLALPSPSQEDQIGMPEVPEDGTTTVSVAGESKDLKVEPERPSTTNEPKTRPPERLEKPVKKDRATKGLNVVELKDKTDVTLDFTSSVRSGSINPLPSRPDLSQGTGIGVTGVSGVSAPSFRTGAQKGRPQQKKNKFSPVAALLVIAVLGGGYWYYSEQMGRGPASEASVAKTMGTLVVESNVKAATIVVRGAGADKTVSTTMPATVKALPGGVPLTVIVTSNGYKRHEQEIVLNAGESKSLYVNLVSDDGSYGQPGTNGGGEKQTVTLRLNIMPPGLGTSIKINGVAADLSGVVTVPIDTPLDVVVERNSFRTYHKNLTIRASAVGQGGTYNLDVALEMARFGFVSIKTTPSADAIISIDGTEETWSTPVSRKRLPVGTYRAKLVNNVLGMRKEITFEVQEDRFTNIEERLSVADGPERLPSSNR